MTHDAIAQLVYRYCRALDRLDADLLRSIFHPDARIDMGAIYGGGVEGFVATAMGFMGSMEATRHCVSNILVDGDRAESYVDAWHLLAGGRELMVRGRYLQRYALVGSDPLIVEHTEVVDFGADRPVELAWWQSDIGLVRGVRGREDRSYAR
jgi:hypothetical protein